MLQSSPIWKLKQQESAAQSVQSVVLSRLAFAVLRARAGHSRCQVLSSTFASSQPRRPILEGALAQAQEIRESRK